MEIYQLRTFLAVARLGHLTRAAEQLHLSQPAVSKQVKALEEELGLPLFERQPSGMLLTAEGKALLPLAERTLLDALDLLNQASVLRGEVAGDFVIGTIIDPETLRLGAFLGDLMSHFPKVQVRLRHGISGWVLDRVREGSVDAGFYIGPLADPEITSVPMCVLHYVVIAPPEWSERVVGADWAAVAAMPWIGTPANSSQHRLVHSMFAEQGLKFSPIIEADQEASMASLVRTGVGLATMREGLAREAEQRGEVCIWPGTLQGCALSFIFKSNRKDDLLIGACCKALADVWLHPPMPV